jgi:thioredoxin
MFVLTFKYYIRTYKQQLKKNIMATIHLTSEQFMVRVGDYKSNPGHFDFLGDKPALIDFYAEWCGPCKMLAPVLEELSGEYAGKVDIYKVNVDEEEELAMLFSIRSIPTLIFIGQDGTMHRTQGAMGKPQLKEAIEKTLL